MELQKEVIYDINDDHLILFGKWGFDGSTGHAEYKQTMMDSDLADSNMFVTSYVPLRMVTKSDHSKIIWKNPRPSSTRYCRPIRFQFKKETTQLCLDEEAYFEHKIVTLKLAKLKYKIEKEISIIPCNLPWLMVKFVMH